MNDLEKLISLINKFAHDRDWDQFHSPKNLAIALTIEASELLEQFQWLTDDQSKNVPQNKKDAIRDEIADVCINLIRLSSKLDINIIDAAFDKIQKNAIKYPVEKAKGNAKKYNEY